jgi:hypothetical protein
VKASRGEGLKNRVVRETDRNHRAGPPRRRRPVVLAKRLKEGLLLEE